MKDLIKYIVRALVDHPEQIEISEITSKQVTILKLKVVLGLFFLFTVYRNILLNISGNPSPLKGQGSCFCLTPCRKFQVSG